MMLDLIIEDTRWEKVGLGELARRAAVFTLSHQGLIPAHCEISLLGCDDKRIAALNGEFRNKPAPTNVLSWPAEDLAAAEPGGTPTAPEADPDGLYVLGDIAISYDTCAHEALAAGKPLADHCAHLIVHGLLHLLGYDHERGPDATVMEGYESEILGKMGLDDPYRVT